MQEIINQFSKKDDWAAVRLNPKRDMLEALVSELSQTAELDEIFRLAKIDLSVLGLGSAIEGAASLFTYRTAAYRMLEALTKAGKRVLISVDGISPTENLQAFIHEFQIYTGDQLSVFLIMTGSSEDLNRLKNKRDLTFLYRAPRVEITSRIPE